MCLFLTTAMLLCSAPVLAGGGGPVTRFVSDGASVRVSFSHHSVEGFVVVVGRNETGRTVETFLTYLLIDRVLGVVLEDGAGLIPNAALTVTGQTATLSLDTAAAPEFSVFTGSGGTINLTWVQNGTLDVTSTGTTEIVTPTSRMRESGKSRSRSATANGSLIGYSLTNEADAVIGSTSQSLLIIERTAMVR